MKCYTKEIFGPVLVCLDVETLDDAIDLINTNMAPELIFLRVLG
jgi:malonate-semialdehyde dehydrogenase (acetylating)/methylmalonate-semialdehyde dehydrogenase